MSLLHFTLRHGSSPPQDLHYTNDHTVGALMHTICQQLGLSTCKLIGLTKGKMPDVNTLLSDLPLSTTSPIKLMVIGTSSSVLEEQSTRDAVYEIERQAQIKAEQERAAREAEARRIWEQQEAARAAEEAERRARWAAENAIRERERAARYAEEEKQRIAREIAAENDVTATIAFQATSSGKLLLPPSALQSIIDRKIAFPLTFQVEVIDSATSTATSTPMETDTATSSSSSSTPIYLGVLDFSAPASTIMIPAFLRTRLNITDGATIRIHNVNIEKGVSVKLQPLNRSWQRLSELERRALLELELRKGHHFITEGEILTFTYAHQVLRFRVTETKPSHIISLIDAELQTEVMPYEDETAAVTATSSSTSTSTSASPDPSIPLPLTIGNPVDIEIKNDGYAYYEFKHDDPNMAIVIDCKARSGDPDLYLIPSSTASLVASSLPSLTHFTWCSQSTRGSKQLTVDQSHAEFTVGNYILAVHAYGEDTKAIITFNTVPASQLSSISGHTVGEADQKDAVKCENCLKFIPSRTYPMHSAQCARINYRCDICQQVMLIRDKEKHQNLIHTKYPCTCGACFDQSSFRTHLRDNCPDRLIECTYCPLRIRYADIGDHRRECGLRHSSCNLCGASMQRKLQRRHQVQHGKEERQVTWKDYWQ